MDMLEMFFYEYDEEAWNRYVSCFETVNVQIDGVPQEEVVHGLSQWHTRRFDLSSRLYSHFILGHTNFMVGSLLFKCDLLPSRFIGSEES